MENKKTDVLFSILVIILFVVTIIMIKDFNTRRANDFKAYSNTITKIVKQKNDRIIMLANLLAEKEKENEDLKSTLTETRNGLENLSKRLAQPAPVAAAPASATAPVAATK